MTCWTASDSPHSSLSPLTEGDSCCRFHGGVNIFRFVDIGERGESCAKDVGDDEGRERVANLCLRLRGLGMTIFNNKRSNPINQRATHVELRNDQQRT
jgi:hypothetical protein